MTNASRRELLAYFLGLPLLGCARRTSLPPGELVGSDHLLGHRVRDHSLPRPEAWEEVPVAIVGAGVAGLTAAWRLAKRKVGFLLLEVEGAAGGTSRPGITAGIPHPWGAHYLPAPMKENTELVELLREMGVIEGMGRDGEPEYAEQVLCRDPHERLFVYGRWQDGLWPQEAQEEDNRQRRLFFQEVDAWVAWRDGKGRRAFTLPIRKGSDDPHVLALDRLTMDEWMKKRGLTSKLLRWSVEYACRDDYGCSASEVSAWAGLFYFASRRRAPGAEPQPLLTWPEGNGRLVKHLARSCAGRLRTGEVVVDVNPTEAGVEVLAVGQRALGVRARRVIFAAPQFIARHVIRPWRESPPRWAQEFHHGPWMVANLRLSGRPPEPQAPLAWDNVIYDSPSLGYVVATHQMGIDHGPTVWTYYYPLSGPDIASQRRDLLSAGRDEWAEVALADLERAHPGLRSFVEQVDVMRWGHAMARPRPGLVSGSALRQARNPFRGVHFAHSDLSGLALFEEAFDHGLRAAEEVLSEMAPG
jgi:protoporphyrinogen oxidase